VDVKVIGFRSQKVYVGGEVKLPATYTVTDVPFTLAEAVNRAGGFLPTADDSRIILTRAGRSWSLNFQALMTQSTAGNRICLRDGDSLMVPNTLENPVYLMGEVIKPGSLPLAHGNLSLAKAISDGGGLSGTTADARSIYVIRQGKLVNSVDVFHLDARNPTAMVMADQFELNPRDIVYVDAGTSVRFSRVMGLLLPTISTVVTGAVGAYEIRYFKRAF
jgi:polysaccharide export outer membrane protein